MNKLVLTFIVSLIIFATTSGQEIIDKTLLAKDLDVLRTNLETYHTGLYTYTSPEEFDQWFATTKKNLEDATPLQFFRKVIELNELVKNGHTFFHINPEQRGKDLLMPPFKIYKEQDRFYITAVNDKRYAETVGKQIIAIDGIVMAEVFQHLLRYEERDGHNLTQPTEELLYSFARKYALAYGGKVNTTVEIMDGSAQKKVTMPNIAFEAFTQKTDELYENGKINFKIEGEIAVLTVPTFKEETLKSDGYKSNLKTIFGKLEKEGIKQLVIDVRNNGGGDTAAVEELLSYILKEPFTFYQDVYQLHKKWDTSIIPAVSSYPKHNGSWALKKGADGHYRANTGVDGKKQTKPKKNTYSGALYVLTNGSTLSAAAEFASFLKNYREATFIGDEPGGNKVQNTSGYSLVIGLPHSKIIASIPILLWKMNVSFENNGHGILPDHWVRNSIQQELKGEDSIMDFAFELIKKERSNSGQN